MSEEIEAAEVNVKGEVCGCPCKHAGPISRRAGFIICSLGKEKLCTECVQPLGSVFRCHGDHSDA